MKKENIFGKKSFESLLKTRSPRRRGGFWHKKTMKKMWQKRRGFNKKIKIRKEKVKE